MILLEFNFLDNIASILLSIFVAGSLSLLTYTFRTHKEETKLRIDARAKEIDDANREISTLQKDMIEVKTKITHVEKRYDELQQLVRDNHKETMKQLYEIMNRLPHV
jgi:predicted  nucleic acid-binding Zn-ribbon protein